MAASGYPGGGRMGTYWIWDRSDFVEVGVNGAVIRLAVVGSLLAGALPVVGVISSIIAVVSLLGDNLEGIRTIVGNVFGEQGLAVFDKFTGALSNVGKFISGLFVDGGVATALSGFREMLFGQKEK